MYDRILLPTDGSTTTDRALEHALDVASHSDATIHVLHVIDATVFANDVETGTIVEEFETAGERIVTEVAERARAADVAVATDVVRGTPHQTILEYGSEHDIDLIVMGTHGRTGLDRYLLGSVTERVVRLSPIPVLTVRSEE